MQDFEKAYERAQCQTSSIMKLNYALTMVEHVQTAGKQILLCKAAELFIDAQEDLSLPKNLSKIATDKATEHIEKCREVSAKMTEEEFQKESKRAIELARIRQREQAILSWRALIRIRNDRIEPHRALCRLLKNTNRHQEAKQRCAAWRFLVNQQGADVDPLSEDYPLWPFFTVSGGLIVAAGLTYTLASVAHTDLLGANRRAVEAADAGDLSRFNQAAKEQRNLTKKMENLQLSTWVLLGSGVVLSGIGTYLWLDKRSVELAFTGTGLEWKVQW